MPDTVSKTDKIERPAENYQSPEALTNDASLTASEKKKASFPKLASLIIFQKETAPK
jgi:hypothetical protein